MLNQMKKCIALSPPLIADNGAGKDYSWYELALAQCGHVYQLAIWLLCFPFNGASSSSYEALMRH